MKKITVVLTSLLALSGTAIAAPGDQMVISTLELVGVCSNSQSGPESQMYCDAYGQGVYDGYLVTRHPKGAPEFICVVQPAPKRREVMIQYMDWVRMNPQYNNFPAADSLLRFLAVRFPCDTSKTFPTNVDKKIIR